MRAIVTDAALAFLPIGTVAAESPDLEHAAPARLLAERAPLRARACADDSSERSLAIANHGKWAA